MPVARKEKLRKEHAPASKPEGSGQRIRHTLLQKPLGDEFVGLGVDSLVMQDRPDVPYHRGSRRDEVSTVLVVVRCRMRDCATSLLVPSWLREE